MKFKQLSTLAISLIGFYSIFSAILNSGIQFMTLVIAPFQNNGLAVYGYMAVTLVSQFAFPLIFGIFLVRKSARISDWLFAKIHVDPDEGIEGIAFENLSFLLFSALGLYMLSVTAPGALKLLMEWFSERAGLIVRPGGVTNETFWDRKLPDAVYHAAANAFAAFVFFRGLSVSKFVLAIRRKSIQHDIREVSTARRRLPEDS